MSKIFIALGIGGTVWCFMSHQPIWVCVLNVVLDIILVLGYLKDNR